MARALRPDLGLLAASAFFTAALVAPSSAGISTTVRQGKAPKAAPTGPQIFQERCAPCHGAHGEGGGGYSKPLAGKRSAAELSDFIHRSMPPSGAKLSAAEAKLVGGFVYDTCYSPVAQARNRPPRVELVRLTVRQFRNAVADLISGTSPVLPGGTTHGLHGEYFKNRDIQPKDRLIDRVDPEVQFDFGTEGPIPNQFDPHHFSAAWQGSVLAPDTGEYEFVVRSDQAVRLWVNGWKQALVDGWVRSAADTEFRGRIFLLGGRAYPIRLEFSKSTVGVDDSAKKKGKPAPRASVSLLWTRPNHATELIPSFCLFTDTVPETFVVSTPFPPDDRSTGYERGNSVSAGWDDATTSAALETADFVLGHLAQVTGVDDNAKDRPNRLRACCRDFIERAFRRPITKEIEAAYIDRQFAAVPDPEAAVKRVIILTLSSPRFLYRDIGDQDGYTVASRLSFELWDSIPDSELRQAAAQGKLTAPDKIAQEAERMASDPRAWNKLRDFLLLWLKVDEVPDIVKSAKQFPDFSAATVSDLRTSLELFLQNTAWSKTSDYRDLMLSRDLYLNGSLAKVYGFNLAANAPFQAVTSDAGQREGVLTQPYLLARFAYLDRTSPIHRGVLIVRNLLGRVLNPPPAAFTPFPVTVHPEFTTRERVALQTKPEMCNACHGIINPLGFTLERYDAIGRMRDKDNDKPVDASGMYRPVAGPVVKFAGAADLAQYLANGDEAHAAFVGKLFLHVVKQPAAAYGPETLANLRRSFADGAYSIRNLMAKIAECTVMPVRPKVKT